MFYDTFPKSKEWLSTTLRNKVQNNKRIFLVDGSNVFHTDRTQKERRMLADTVGKHENVGQVVIIMKKQTWNVLLKTLNGVENVRSMIYDSLWTLQSPSSNMFLFLIDVFTCSYTNNSSCLKQIETPHSKLSKDLLHFAKREYVEPKPFSNYNRRTPSPQDIRKNESHIRSYSPPYRGKDCYWKTYDESGESVAKHLYCEFDDVLLSIIYNMFPRQCEIISNDKKVLKDTEEIRDSITYFQNVKFKIHFETIG